MQNQKYIYQNTTGTLLFLGRPLETLDNVGGGEPCKLKKLFYSIPPQANKQPKNLLFTPKNLFLKPLNLFLKPKNLFLKPKKSFLTPKKSFWGLLIALLFNLNINYKTYLL